MEVEIKTPPKENGKPKTDELSPKLVEVSETNGKSNEELKPAKQEETKTKSPEPVRRSRRSRSKTPTTQKKNKQKKAPKEKEPEVIEENHERGDEVAAPEVVESVKESINGNNEEQLKEAEAEATNSAPAAAAPEAVDMEPLVLNADEPDPELEFDENSDKESGKSSPIISRCMTRRSQNRNIPTPKTPKPVEQEPQEKKDHTYDSIDLNLSTKVEVGSDATRLDFELEESMGESYLQNCRNRSLRGLSSRRSIRPSNEEYLKRAIKNNSVGGIKRKNRSETPEYRKKMRMESPGILSRLSSPLASFRNRFRAEATSSTPKLTGYKDNSNGLSCAGNQIEVENGAEDKKSWCTVM
ncbi:unnamed protein product [Brassicogethes aeneus]|uniref:Uncharacterized protein n=1 Tax=Brassicogethes aeneus TaxID=1431903 RepID=A0A9P0B1A8_BRAAE|nr:unnamed protein product [Brassicogethes aeneus]